MGEQSQSEIEAVAMLKAMRLLCAVAVFAFTSFSVVDPLVIPDYSVKFILVRALFIGCLLLILGVSHLNVSNRMIQHLGGAACVLTGMGVAVLTEMTGGASSPYWTMIMLTFFGTALILPITARWAAVYFGLVAGFYYVWLSVNHATADPGSWAGSNSGIWLAVVVSVIGVGYIHQMRERERQNRLTQNRLNNELLTEIEQRRESNEKLLHAQKMDAIGQLAAGVAHEMNNVLTAVSYTAESIKKNAQGDPELGINVSRILSAAERGERLTSGLLGFARKMPQEMSQLSLSRVVNDVSDMVGRTHRGRFNVETDITADDSPIYGDERLLFQALLNLYLNGIDAMEEGNTLLIRMNARSIDDETGGRAGVEVHVQDFGVGMSPEHQARIFEPFFTTKPVGKGTGLGLAMVYGTVDDHDGLINVQSAPGEGTTISLWFPMVTQETATKDHNALPLATGNAVTGSILVLDDDPLVRGVTCQILRKAGLTVLDCQDGATGLELYTEHQNEVSLVIIDIIMPGMDGAEVFRRIRSISPQQPILLVSGFAQKEVVQPLLEEDACRFLKKPFTARELLTIVQSLVREQPPLALSHREKSVSILLVEDDPLLSELTVSALMDCGYTVTPAETAEAALHTFDHGDYDIVLLDLGLPDRCGIEVATELRTHQKGQHVPIIAVTGRLSSEMHEKCSRVGFNAFISKPYGLDDLARHIDLAVGSH